MKYGDLITVGLKCYNQRGTIGAALDAALCQTYRPLQVIVADDGSTDGSYELLQDRIAARTAQDVEVVLLRNEVNLGNMGNWLRICAAAKGEWLVKADGDDASEPNRAVGAGPAPADGPRRARGRCHGESKMVNCRSFNEKMERCLCTLSIKSSAGS